MKKLIIILALLLSFDSVFAQQEKLAALLKQNGIPGIQLVYIRGGKVEDFNIGTISGESAKKVTSHTIFEAASLGKSVFAYLTLRLYDRGVLSLDTPLIRYVGTYNRFGPGDPRYARITARMVLRHTSGLPNEDDGQGDRLLFSPDSTFSYSGEGFQYLQYVVEKLTGKSLNELAQQEVFTPLRMASSSYAWDSKFDTLAAFGNSPDAINAHRQQRAASSLLTCARDYMVFLQALMSGKGLRQETHRMMLEKQSAGNWYGHTVTEANRHIWWGLGIGLQENETGKWLWQWGNNGGFKGFYMADSATNTALVYFTHSDQGLQIVSDVLDAFFPRQTWWAVRWGN